PLPLSDAAYRAVGRAFLLEVSEDDGATWSEPAVQAATLESLFAVRLRGVANLASVNAAALADGAAPAVADGEKRIHALLTTA
ncbi:MAG: hypothetical protein AAFY08_16635, partial [Planctomycetota bacterium]